MGLEGTSGSLMSVGGLVRSDQLGYQFLQAAGVLAAASSTGGLDGSSGDT